MKAERRGCPRLGKSRNANLVVHCASESVMRLRAPSRANGGAGLVDGEIDCQWTRGMACCWIALGDLADCHPSTPQSHTAYWHGTLVPVTSLSCVCDDDAIHPPGHCSCARLHYSSPLAAVNAIAISTFACASLPLIVASLPAAAPPAMSTTYTTSCLCGDVTMEIDKSAKPLGQLLCQ